MRPAMARAFKQKSTKSTRPQPVAFLATGAARGKVIGVASRRWRPKVWRGAAHPRRCKARLGSAFRLDRSTRHGSPTQARFLQSFPRPAAPQRLRGPSVDRERRAAALTLVRELDPDILVLNEALFCRAHAGTTIDYGDL